MDFPTVARVDLAAIRHNVEVMRERAAGAELMAVVKADAYGHGLVPCAHAALTAGAGRLGTAFIGEALTLRQAGIGAPILAWIITPGDRLEEAIAEDIEVSVGALWLLDDLMEAARRRGRTARVHLKIDTGTSRGGATATEWEKLLDRAAAAQTEGLVEVTGIWSHLACADTPGHPSIDAQTHRFDEAMAMAEKAGVAGSHVIRHLSNSAATLTLSRARFDMVRLGSAIYGLPSVPELGDCELRPAMTLVSTVSLVKRVPPGSGVSYGHEYVTDRETTLAMIPLGYADGIQRRATNRCDVFAGGRRRTVAGRVCMDQFMIDVGDDALSLGDEVIIFGPGEYGEPTAQEWADRLGTISYEIVTGVGTRVPRIYV
ncbi:alanine racemase [Spongiactinospora sp. 9N601]|uniref:alanine racemase n=1 Tax=Spongiactinospora sp. 9N601 TaxID=3375149 RepID=UPI0037B2136F